MSPSHNEFVVPKLRVRVVVALRGETPRPHELFVSQHEDHGWRLQDLYELLEGGARFLPAFEVEARAYVVLQKAALKWVRLAERPPNEDPLANEDALFDKQERVWVALADGESLEGDLLFSPAPGHGRVADFLNEAGAFFSLWTDEGEMLVAKAHVVRVAEAGRTPSAKDKA